MVAVVVAVVVINGISSGGGCRQLSGPSRYLDGNS